MTLTTATDPIPGTEPAMNAQMNVNADVTPLNSRVQQFISQPRKVLIDGRWVAAKSGQTVAEGEWCWPGASTSSRCCQSYGRRGLMAFRGRNSRRESARLDFHQANVFVEVH